MARTVNGRTTPGSGSGRIKGDVQTRDTMFELKTTAKTQFTVKLRDLEKLEVEASAAGRSAVFVIRMADDSPILLSSREWALLPLTDYLALVEATDE